MKKFLIIIGCFLGIICCSSCYKDDYYPDFNQHQNHHDINSPQEEDDNDGPTYSPENDTRSEQIKELYAIKMRRELPYPFSSYVMRLSDGRYYYLWRGLINQDLHPDDIISFKTYSLLPDEISQVTSVQSGRSAVYTGKNIVATDPTEATVSKTFELGVRYGLPFVPIRTVFIDTGDNLIYVKKIKLNLNLQSGDRIVYNVYRLFPNEILAIKKLN